MLVIPPGWEIVDKSKNPLERIQVKCSDAKGRAQYIYHPLWPILSARLKFMRLCNFCKNIKKIKKHSDPQSDIDTLIKLMLLTNIRVGCDKYAEDNETFGVCTLLSKHVRKTGNGKVKLEFCGKSGHDHEVEIADPEFVKFILNKKKKVSDNKTGRLFPNGTAEKLRIRFKEIVGEDFNPKDLRTYKANVTLVKNLRKLEGKSPKKESVVAIKKTADSLHHTASVCKKNYICPDILDLWLEKPEVLKSSKCNSLEGVIKLLKIN
tara:strand:+ start:110 stop:901 length:792 start_codon:yes stop_codon:yes gene_type:complete